MKRPTIRYVLSVTALVALCSAVVATGEFDVVANMWQSEDVIRWMQYYAFLVGLATVAHLTAILFGLSQLSRWVLCFLIPPALATTLWYHHAISFNYKSTVPASLVFTHCFTQFLIVGIAVHKIYLACGKSDGQSTQSNRNSFGGDEENGYT
jgi:hypothetical protein